MLIFDMKWVGLSLRSCIMTYILDVINFLMISGVFGSFFKMLTDGHTDTRTHGRTDGRTDPHIEMRGRI